MPKQFSHFHVHTESSLLDGLARMKDIFKVAAADGQGVMAVTDHGTTGGLFKAKQAAKDAGVDLAPGVELYIAIDTDGTFGNRFNPGYQVTAGDLADDSDDNEGTEKRKGYYHLTLVATSTAGWRNLVRITNASEQTKKGRYPMADLKLLAEDTEGLVVLTGCLGGPVLGPTAGGNIDLARKNLSEIIDAFGHDNVFLEVMEHGIGVETKAMPRMWELSQEFGIPMVATNDSHFTHDCDAHAHDAWLALRTLSGKTGPSEYERPLDNPKRYRFTGHGYHIRTADEMYGLFAPDRPFEGQWPERGLTREQFLLLQGALDNPILPMMLRPAEVSDDQLAAVRAWLAGDGTAPEDDAVAELILRIVREAFYLKEFGRPAQTPSHPRNWWHQACENTQLIASRVEADIIPDNPAMLPSFPTPSGYESTRHFIFDHIRTGARRIYGAELPEDVRNRLKVEWKTIDDMGFADYFAIVYDVVNWSKSPYCVHATDRFEPTFDDGWTCSVEGCTGRKKPILVGPGRGSGAGSMTAYALTITGLDPLRHDLLFERFIEYGRSDWPDFDIDFERERRDEILDYLEHKWGAGHVALIGSYGIAKSRRAVKDAARLLGQGKIGALLTKVIPVEGGNPLGFDALLDPENQSTAEFRRQLALGGAAAQEVLELAMSFDSVINGASIHACGVIISDRYLPDMLPLRVMKKTLANGEERHRLVTQWDSKDCEKFGMLKLDILSLRNLDIMATAFEYIREQTGEVFTMETIPDPSDTSDPRVQKAWRLLQDGRTEGIFQAEGAAMTQLIQDVQPENEEHLSAIYALFRPGPISAGMPEHYGLRKNGKEVVEYGMYTNDPHEGEWLAKQLGSSYGILAFQEQMMLLGTIIAGFTAGQRSTLRRAIGKKNAELMASIKGEFIDGAGREFFDDDGTLISPVFKVQTAELVWKMFEGAAAYAFNKSHSMAYAYLGYYTAFLKANWPGAYGAAILANTTDKDRRVQALLALPAEGIEVLPPDVNLSQAKSRPEGVEQVRIGLTEVAEMKEAGYAVVAAREESGPFKSFSDLVFRVRVDEDGHKKLPSNQILALIESGAMDLFGKRMGLAMVARLAAEVLPAPVPDMEWGVIERSARQRQRLGVSLGEHPLVVFRDQVRNWSKVADTSYGSVTERAIPISMIPNEAGTFVTVIGLLAAFTEGSYKGGRKAAIVIEGSRERIDGIMWDGELSKQRDVVHEDGTVGIPQIGWPVAVTARVTLREFEKEDDEGNITLVVERQLTVRRIDAVVIDDPVTGSLPPAPAVPVLVVDGEPEPAHAERELDASPSACSSPEEAAVPAEPAAEPESFVPDASDASDWFDELFGLGDPEPAESTPEPAQAEADGEYDLDDDGIPYFTRRSATARSYLDLLAVVPASFKEGNTRLEPKSLTKLSRERGVFELLGTGDRVVARIKLV